MPLFLKCNSVTPGEPMLWVYRDVKVFSIGHRKYYNKPYLAVVLGTDLKGGGRVIWYRYGVSVGFTHKVTEFKGDFSPGKGWVIGSSFDSYFDRLGSVCGKLDLTDPYAVFKYLKKCTKRVTMHDYSLCVV